MKRLIKFFSRKQRVFKENIFLDQKRSSEEKKIKIAEHFRSILTLLELDIEDPSLKNTPDRVARLYVDEVFAGLNPETFPKVSFYPIEIPKELIVIKHIPFVSFCEHHFVPMIGKAYVGYMPYKKVLGFSHVSHIVRHFAKRPQLQERITAQIADSLKKLLEIESVAVLLEMSHFCMLVQGVENQATSVETSHYAGDFDIDSNLRHEFLLRVQAKDESQHFISL